MPPKITASRQGGQQESKQSQPIERPSVSASLHYTVRTVGQTCDNEHECSHHVTVTYVLIITYRLKNIYFTALVQLSRIQVKILSLHSEGRKHAKCQTKFLRRNMQAHPPPSFKTKTKKHQHRHIMPIQP